MIANAIAIKPPAPRPWSARKPINWPMFCDNPDSADPIRKITIAVWNMILRPYRSLTLPYSGVDAVDVNKYAVTTHDKWSKPPRSPTIVGNAVATIV